MIGDSPELPSVSLSVKVYQALLVAYPARFRKEYGAEMARVFQDCCLRAMRQPGTNPMLRLWLITLLDLAQSALSEHMQKETNMDKQMKPEDIRRAGWALIAGAISLTLSISLMIIFEDRAYWFGLLLLVFVSLPLSVFGVLGLRSRYGEKAGGFAKNILLAGAILGPLTSIIGFLVTSFGQLWFLPFSGPAVLFFCLTLFGLVALHTRPLPRGNILPVLAGFSYPLMVFSYVIISWVTGDWSGNGSIPGYVGVILMTIQGLALIALGAILKGDVSEQRPAMA